MPTIPTNKNQVISVAVCRGTLAVRKVHPETTEVSAAAISERHSNVVKLQVLLNLLGFDVYAATRVGVDIKEN